MEVLGFRASSSKIRFGWGFFVCLFWNVYPVAMDPLSVRLSRKGLSLMKAPVLSLEEWTEKNPFFPVTECVTGISSRAKCGGIGKGNGKRPTKSSAFVYSPAILSGSLVLRNSCFLDPFSQWAMDTLEKCPLKWAMGPPLAIPQSQVGENSLLTAKGWVSSIMNLSAVLKKSHVLLPLPNKWLLQSLINFSLLLFCGKVSPWPGDKLCLFLYLGEHWPAR